MGNPYRRVNSSQNTTSTSHLESPVTSNKDAATASPSQVFCGFLTLFTMYYDLTGFYIGVKAVMQSTSIVFIMWKAEALISSWSITFF